MAQNVKKVASKNLKKPKVAENLKSCRKVAEQLVAKPTPRAIIPDARPLVTFENQDTGDGKTRYISPKNRGL